MMRWHPLHAQKFDAASCCHKVAQSYFNQSAISQSGQPRFLFLTFRYLIGCLIVFRSVFNCLCLAQRGALAGDGPALCVLAMEREALCDECVDLGMEGKSGVCARQRNVFNARGEMVDAGARADHTISEAVKRGDGDRDGLDFAGFHHTCDLVDTHAERVRK